MRCSRQMFRLLSGTALLTASLVVAACGGGGSGGGGGITYDNARANGTYTFVLISGGGGFGGGVGEITFDGAGNAVFSGITPTFTGTLTYTVTTDNTITLSDPAGTPIVGTLRSGGSFFVGTDTTSGNETIIVAVKKSTTLVSDSTATYLLGHFNYRTHSQAGISQVEWATPNPGVATGTDLYPVPNPPGTESYTFNNAYGTFSLPTITPDRFGAITSDHQLMIVGGGGTTASPEMVVACGFKLPGSGMTAASLSGTYMMYQFKDGNPSGPGTFITSRGQLTLDGAGNGTYTDIAKSTGTLDPGGSFNYAVYADGTFTLSSAPDMLGVAIQDGSVFGLVDGIDNGNGIAIFIGVKK